MKFFQNRAVAAVIAILVIVCSTLFAGRANLIKACTAQEEAFFSVPEGKAPAYYVDQLISAAASLANVAEKYDLGNDAAAIREARRELVKAEDSKDISDIYSAYRKLLSAVGDFGTPSVSDSTDKALYEDNLSVISGASRELEQSSYNVNVSVFLETVYSRFPSSLFARLFSIPAPELFA